MAMNYSTLFESDHPIFNQSQNKSTLKVSYHLLANNTISYVLWDFYTLLVIWTFHWWSLLSGLISRPRRESFQHYADYHVQWNSIHVFLSFQNRMFLRMLKGPSCLWFCWYSTILCIKNLCNFAQYYIK